MAAKVWLYAPPTVPSGNAAVVITGTALIMIDNACSSNAAAASSTRTVKLDVPAVVGVPLMTPVAPSSTRPAGKAPTEIDQFNGAVPPVAVSVCV